MAGAENASAEAATTEETMIHNDHESHVRAGLVELRVVANFAEGHAKTGCQQCAVEALTLRCAIAWLEALHEFSRALLVDRLRAGG